MSHLHKSLRYDTRQTTILDILTIYSPSRTLNLRNIFPLYIQQDLAEQANTSEKDLSFQDLNMKVIGSVVHIIVYDKGNGIGIPIVNFLCLSGDVPLNIMFIYHQFRINAFII